MATSIESDRPPLGRLAIAGMASLGAGAIHGAAIGVHSEHRQAVITFAVVTAFQLAWGALALVRSGPLVALAGAVGNGVLVGGFLLAKTSGLSMIDGLQGVEKVQLPDGMAAFLAAASALLALAAVVSTAGAARSRTPRLLAPLAAAAVVVLTLPAMAATGEHHHDEGVGEVAADGHTHSHGDAGGTEASAVVPPQAYDPAKPIDLSGVPGVTPEQQARAENEISVTLLRLPKFADTATAEAAGYRSIGDAATGYEHYINWSYLDDDHLLDPDYAESLVYRAYPDGRRQLQAAMYMLTTKDTLDTVPDLGGALTQWHIHDNLCFTDEPGNYKVRGLTQPDGTCRPPLVKLADVPMIHVWIVPHPCGPFAALEGVGAGQIKPGESRLCDHAHGGTGTTF